MNYLITGGPTREPIDQVRYISNRSSGRMAVALCRAAVESGHDVTLLLGPCDAAPPDRVRLERFESCADLQRLLDTHFASCDVLIMAAAVGDFRPIKVIEGKLLRRDGEAPDIHLEATPDLVSALARHRADGQRIVAFALESRQQMEQRGAEKLHNKGVDAVVVNPLTTIDAESIDPLWLTASGGRESPGPMSKEAFARWLLERLDEELNG
jgi:phosphopantothenoylcysteine decarboxylase/phosphopantothenate--cysteine ligase